MFLDIDKKERAHIAMIDDLGQRATYGDIVDFADVICKAIAQRTVIFILNSNCVGSAMGYLGSMINRVVPLMLAASMDAELLAELIQLYQPQYLWKPIAMLKVDETVLLEAYDYALVATGRTGYPLYEDLSLLLTTSGSTGSPKLVRHSYENLEAQARNISAFFELDGTERPMVDLPINYTMGLSVLNSHLYAGATVLLTSMNALHPKYWEFLKAQEVTSLTNVPYYYEILKKLRFFRMNLPSLRMISQGGGKLSDELYRECAEYAHNTGRKFIPTYGQTEGSARMAYLPAELALEKCGSIGKAIPNGKLYLVDEAGNPITTPGVIGEMVYEGPNVTLGYAQRGEDLLLGDERQGILYTGDLVRTDEDGFFYIVGRKKRFLKLWGYRVGLDECENIIKSAFDVECACVGDDTCMRIYVNTETAHDEIKRYIADKTNINSAAFQVCYVEQLPRNEAGKILYSKLQ
ncbi:MAG: o-succinylbenzoate--CoA ligase [Lachnospiraceae bacterium]|nr:o-succinylbenzoate--CoA ligase [Lachnospiraceae bacterium]